MPTALEDLATTADEVADEQRAVARQARTLQRRRDRGWSWVEILDREPGSSLIGRLRRTVTQLAGATGRIAHALAADLSAEGESRRRIARRLGVTHQRVTAMLNAGIKEARSNDPAQSNSRR
jgi:hypothetical protein